MKSKVTHISRATPIEDAQRLWDALNEVGVATESFVTASLGQQPELQTNEKSEAALHNLVTALHVAKTRFAKVTGWFPVSVYTDRLQEGVTGRLFSQEALDRAVGGALHFDVLVEAFTFSLPELKHQAVEQAYQELIAAAPLLGQLGDWAQNTLRRACGDAIAGIYGSAAVSSALQN